MVMTSNLVITDVSLQRSHWHHQWAPHNAVCWLYPAVGANYLLEVWSGLCGVWLGCGVSSPKSSQSGALGPLRVLERVFVALGNLVMGFPEKWIAIILLLFHSLEISTTMQKDDCWAVVIILPAVMTIILNTIISVSSSDVMLAAFNVRS